MKLHSINQESKTAIIDYMGNLIEAEYYISEMGNLWLTNESCAICDNDGISKKELRSLIYRHIASSPRRIAQHTN